MDPCTPGVLGGVDLHTVAQEFTPKEALQALLQELANTLHCPIRRRFPTLPVLVFHVDVPLKKWNRKTWHLLTVIDVLSKYAWLAPVNSKRGKAVMAAFESILRHSGGRR